MDKETFERRLAAIMMIDVVGYSKLVRADEEGTIARVLLLQKELINPSVSSCGGRTVKTMGDGFLIEFSSAVKAVQAAVEIQIAMERRNSGIASEGDLVLRIGVNVGDVLSEGDDILGDGVNVAARLEALSAPGRLCISDSVYEQVRDRVNATFEDAGPQTVKNIDRPVKVWMWKPKTPKEAVSPVTDTELQLPKKPSIAVLPFENMSRDPDQDYFAEGIAEDIITALSRIEWFFIISRTSSFTFKDRTADVKEIGRELGVRYILEGSIRTAGHRLRVTAQLIDAVSSNHVWAEKYDREMADVFEVQDEITRNVVSSLHTQIQLAEGSYAVNLDKPSLPVWMLVNRAWKLTYELSKTSLPEAIRIAEEAVAIDPNSGRANQVLASALFHWAWLGFCEEPEMAFSRASKVAERALRLNSGNEYAHWIMGLIKMVEGEHDRGIAEMERAIEINPNCSLAIGSLASIQNWAGYPDRSIENSLLSIRSNPRDPSMFFRFNGLGISHYLIGRLDDAVAWSRKAINLKPGFLQPHAFLIASLQEQGDFDGAKIALRDCLVDCSDASIEKVREFPFRLAEHCDRLVASLTEAGME